MKLQSRYIFSILGASVLMTMMANAESVQPSLKVVGSQQVTIHTSEVLPDGSRGTKVVAVERVVPSEDFLKRRLQVKNGVTGELDYSAGITPFAQSKGAVDLAMNNVPVLDQGQEGTCVTFSTTAAMDALLGQGDFISQQCTLELTLGLGNNYWDGADYSSQIIDPLKEYGLVQQGNCDYSYPYPNWPIAAATYASYASTTVNADAIKYTYTNGITLAQVKTILNNKHRLTIGLGLAQSNDPISVDGFNMLISGQETSGGLWACQQPSSATNYCGTPTAGHEVVVIGYDDTQQLLKIRNSWNTTVGDDGDYYMTYTFFAAMVGDGTEIYANAT